MIEVARNNQLRI